MDWWLSGEIVRCGMVHPVAVRVAEWLEDVEGADVLELGAGVGLPGLVAALKGARVTLTDRHAGALALLRRNAALADLGTELAVVSSTPAVRQLSFGERPAWLHSAFDIAIATDVLYEAGADDAG